MQGLQAAAQCFAQSFPYQAFASPAQEKVVKNYIAYLGEEKRFGAEISNAGLSEVVGRTVRVWTASSGGDTVTLEPARVHGSLLADPIDVYRVNTHYQLLDTQQLAALGIDPNSHRGEVHRAQLGAATDLPIEEALLKAGMAVDVGGDGNCQFLVIAYACNMNDFTTIHRKHASGMPTRDEIAAQFRDEPALAGASEQDAFTYFCERTAQNLRTALVEKWIARLQSADYESAPAVQKWMAALEQAAHNEVGEILGKVTSSNPSHSWTVGIGRHASSALQMRMGLVENFMGFCPESDRLLHARGTKLLDDLRVELARRTPIVATRAMQPTGHKSLRGWFPGNFKR
ncbi:MAG: hypothetical protein EOO40_04400 [Deltaproteobacteria bacterium]|nr:MAG: hypothetical protein EOO40_04400 [Deltaproteobacteria bacterium]